MGGERCGNVARDAAGKPIANGLALPLRLHNALAAQDGEMLRHKNGLKAKVAGQPADALISLNQTADDHETVRARQRPHQLACFPRSCGHV